MVKHDTKITMVSLENRIGEQFSKVVIDQILGLLLLQQRNLCFIDYEIKDINVWLGGKFVENALALGKLECAGFNLLNGVIVSFFGKELLLFTNNALGTS